MKSRLNAWLPLRRLLACLSNKPRQRAWRTPHGPRGSEPRAPGRSTGRRRATGSPALTPRGKNVLIGTPSSRSAPMECLCLPLAPKATQSSQGRKHPSMTYGHRHLLTAVVMLVVTLLLPGCAFNLDPLSSESPPPPAPIAMPASLRPDERSSDAGGWQHITAIRIDFAPKWRREISVPLLISLIALLAATS